jgi:hypothetical protein
MALHAGGSPQQTSGGCGAARCQGLTSPRMRTSVTEDGMCAGGTATANSDPRDGVQSGQRPHHVKEGVRDHGSGDVVGLFIKEKLEHALLRAHKPY